MDHRCLDGCHIEYLVRWSDPAILNDTWEKASDLTCAHKILAHWENRNPPHLVPRLLNKEQLKEALVKHTDDSDVGNEKLRILGLVKTPEGEIKLSVIMPNETEEKLVSREDLQDNYAEELIDFYEANSANTGNNQPENNNIIIQEA